MKDEYYWIRKHRNSVPVIVRVFSDDSGLLFYHDFIRGADINYPIDSIEIIEKVKNPE